MQFDAELLLLAIAPVFLACIVREAWRLHRTRPEAGISSWRDTMCNAAPALLQQQGTEKIAWLAVFPFYAFVYHHYPRFTWQAGWPSFAMLLVALSVARFAPPARAAARHARLAGIGTSIRRSKK